MQIARIRSGSAVSATVARISYQFAGMSADLLNVCWM
jgi:hypothetical protein